MKPTVLILCTGNSCRSHIAEGILRQAVGDIIDAQSAGSNPAGYVHPRAVQVMREIGIDISGHHSKHMNEFLGQNIHTVITVCGNADQACPMFPGQVNRYHWGFDDPAHTQGTDEEITNAFRRIRDEMGKVFGAYAAGLKIRTLEYHHEDKNLNTLSEHEFRYTAGTHHCGCRAAYDELTNA